MLSWWFFSKSAARKPDIQQDQQPGGVLRRLLFPWQQLNGRLYALDSTYMLPVDRQESDRLNFQHHLLYNATGNHYFAPLPGQLDSILDVGCGTGIWAVELAKLYPDARVQGVDLIEASFGKISRPINCTFSIADVLKGLPYPPRSFAYVHQRFLVAGIKANDWPQVVAELTRVTRPGGWLELVEVSGRFDSPGPQTLEFMEAGNRLSVALGFRPDMMEQLDHLLLGAGIAEVETQILPVPVGEWGGRIGQSLMKNMLTGYSAMKPAYCQQLGMRPEKFDQYLRNMTVEWSQYHSSFLFFAAYGRRR